MLPVLDLEADIVAALRSHRRLVLSAPTGSGKSTQLPRILLRHGFLDRGQAVVLQPRRLATRLLAARVAAEEQVPLGREVGYQVRFDDRSSPATRIRFVTEGVLLRQMAADPRLPGVAALVFDEFHERHLEGDVALARALEHPDLLLVVMSATLDVDAVAAHLAPCARLSSDGRVHPVRIEHDPGEGPVWDRAADAVAARPGDALVFMPGAYEIHRTLDALRARLPGVALFPLHGELPPADQDAAVAPHDRRKVIVATNVAETSITIDGITLVVDSGLARIARHDPVRGINTLSVEKISRASADQRAGRAGRTAPGVCVRLWPERETRAARELPEIRRLDLAETVLQLKAAGVESLRWLEPPDPKAWAAGAELLEALGALRAGAATDLGRRMAAFPVHPRVSRMLIAAQELGCVREAALVAALIQGRDLLLRNVGGDTDDFREERFGKSVSDFDRLRRAWTWAAERNFDPEVCRRAGLNLVAARQVRPVFEQLLRLAGSDSSGGELGRCLLVGFPDRLARRLDEGTLRCELVGGRRGLLARESAARGSEFLVAAEVREVKGQPLLTMAAGVEAAWIRGQFGTERRVAVEWDAGARRVVAEEREESRGLVLSARRVDPPAAEAARILAAELLSGRLRLEGWGEEEEQFVQRVNLLARLCPELGIAPFGEVERRAAIERMCEGAVSYREVKDRRPVLSGGADLDRHAPARVELPGGRRAKVVYSASEPWFAARIQDLYGLQRAPVVAMGRIALVVHVLAPNQRPVQVTRDLAGFWRDHYPKVKAELQRRYPKHEWR